MWFKSFFKFNTISRSIYQNQNVAERIRIFQTIDFGKESIPTQSITNPSFLDEARAKDILEYVKTQNIPNNIRILHALAHIQYNAFMSYADTLLRFKAETGTLEKQFIGDMKSIAVEEGRHFMLLQQRLVELGYDYGCMPVIAKLSQAIKSTEQNLVERIGVISLIHQGRGVKAVEKLLNQLAQVQDQKSIEVVKVIQKDEFGHFQMGWKWFIQICQLKQLNINDQVEKINSKYKSNIVIPSKEKKI